MSEPPRYQSDQSIPFRSTWWLPVVFAGIGMVLWYGVAGVAGAHKALPWLLAALVLSWLCDVTAILVFTPYRAMPRAMKLRQAVEFALLWSRMSMAGTESFTINAGQAKFHLRHAVAAATNPSLKGRLRTLAEEASQSGVDSARVRAELSAILRQLATDKRTKAAREFVPAPMAFLWTMSLFVACISLAPRLDKFPSAPVSFVDLAVSLTAAVAAYPLTKLLLLAHYKLGIYRLHANRIVFVTDQPDSPMIVPALLHFSRRAQLVAVFVGERRKISLPLNGAEVFFGSCDFALNVCEALVPACDRLVVHCDDITLADELLVHAKARGTACEALSADGFAPVGYEWLDPVVLRSHGQPPASLANTGAQFAAGLALAQSRRVPLWAEPRPWRWLGGSAILLSVDGAMLGGMLTFISAACEWGVKILEPRRRARIGREVLRAPRYAGWSARLDPKKLEWRLRLASWSVALLAFAIFGAIHFETLKEAGRFTGVAVFLLLWPVFFATEAIVTTALLGIKWFLDWNFRIVVFRRNSTAFGYAHKAIVLAVCGRYGQVASLTDYSLQATTSGTGEWREEHLGTWFHVFSEVWTPLVPDVFLRDWRLQVISELAAGDAAIFDWAEEVTDNMRWELRVATQLLPANRILVVYGSTHAAQEARFLAAMNNGRKPPIATSMLPRTRDDQYVWPDNRAFAAGFEDALHRLLRGLSNEPRPWGSLVATETSAAVLDVLDSAAAEGDAA